MPRPKIIALVPGSIEQVYQHVTAFPAEGAADRTALESQYGKLLEASGNDYTFREDIGGGVTWHCRFDPPTQRRMRTVDSTWSDRTDRFDAAEGGTLWTISWEQKAQGLAAYSSWLVFQIKDKRRVYRQMVLPVVSHFREMG